MKILLFDVDGVLVEPRAYRIGVTETMRKLCERVGVPNPEHLLPSADELSHLESCGIHDVWDMTSIMFAQILFNMQEECRTNNVSLSGSTLSERLESLRQIRCRRVTRPNYGEFANEISQEPGTAHPPDVAKRIISSKIAKDGSHIFSEPWHAIIEDFLSQTRSALDNTATKLFQNIILGQRLFETTYGLPDEYGGTSLLEREDRTLLTAETAQLIAQAASEKSVLCAIYTARPSLPPTGQSTSLGFSPEAELAVAMANMAQYPLVGMGTMDWLALQHCRRSEDLTKPNTTQALSALIAAITQTCRTETCEEAFSIDFEGIAIKESSLSPLFSEPSEIVVFEDTISGIRPLQAITARLRSQGCDIKLSPHGIATNESKRKALQEVAVQVFPDINEAVAHTLTAT